MTGEYKVFVNQALDDSAVLMLKEARAGQVGWNSVNLGAVLATSPGMTPSDYVLRKWDDTLLDMKKMGQAEVQRWLHERGRPIEQLTRVHVREQPEWQRVQIVFTFNNRDAALLYRLAN